MERLKSIPAPLWIGAGLAILVVIFVTRDSGNASAATPQLTAQNSAPSDTANALAGLEDSFNAGLKAIMEHEDANNKVTLQAITASNQSTTAAIADSNKTFIAGLTTLSQADAQRTAVLQQGFTSGLQQIVTTQAQANAQTTDALKSISQALGSLGSSMANFGASLQSLRQQSSVVYTGAQEIQTSSGGGGGGGSRSSSSSQSFTLPNIVSGGSIQVSGGSLAEAQANAAKATGVSLAQQKAGGTFGINTNPNL